jgi:hypothetical protein
MPVSAALQIALDTSKGLDFAHRRGIVHRDISPSNILISRSGEVKIADFGIAKAVASREDSRRIMGKWRYMSPEQAVGAPVDGRSDLFSLGAVLHELFTGQKLFPGDDPQTVAANVQKMPVPPATSIRPELPPGLDAALLRCLERDPAARWQSAGELHRALVEIAYARTVVVTNGDVAELIARVAPAPRRTTPVPRKPGLDELIAAELHGGEAAGDPSLSRVTVPHDDAPGTLDGGETTTFVRRDVDDGLSELLPAGAGVPTPTVVARKVRASVPPEHTPDHTPRGDAPGLPLVTVTPSLAPQASPITPMLGSTPVFTEDGAVVAPAAPMTTDRVQRLDTPPPAPAPRSGVAPRVVVLLVAAALAAGLAGVMCQRSQGPTGPLVERSRFAGPPLAPVPLAALEVVSEPPGATVAIDGVTQGVAPTVVKLTGGAQRYRLELTLAGHRTFVDEGVVLAPGERLRYVRALVPARASLDVRSTPPGAEVFLDDKLLGESPLSVADLPADGQPHRLRLVVKGRTAYEETITLVDGARVAVAPVLETQQRLGRINLAVEPWAYVYHEGQRVAEAPVQGLKLPVGRVKLRLWNPVLKREKIITVDVPASGVGKVTVELN